MTYDRRNTLRTLEGSGLRLPVNIIDPPVTGEWKDSDSGVGGWGVRMTKKRYQEWLKMKWYIEFSYGQESDHTFEVLPSLKTK